MKAARYFGLIIVLTLLVTLSQTMVRDSDPGLAAGTAFTASAYDIVGNESGQGQGVLGFGENAQSAAINAASCEQTDVQAAIDSATTGDTVIVPAGSCTWSSSVSIPNDKKITLQGAGMDSTVITGAGVDMTQSGSRVTGFGFINCGIGVDGDGWRVDHCKFHYTSSWGDGVYVPGDRSPAAHPTGLVDNCSFYNARVLIYGTISMFAEGNQQNVLWTNSLDLGTNNNVVYVEDCNFEFDVFGNAIDANYGAAYVFRFNHVSGVYIELHSMQGDNRGTRRWEIYENTIDSSGGDIYLPYRVRAGTGVVFNDTIVGNWSMYGIGLDNVRSYSARGDGGMCTGGSLWDGNEALITGSHTGGNGEINLTDSSKSWDTNELASIVYGDMIGTHTGSNDASILTTTELLTDADNDREGQILHNLTDGSHCEITSNTAHTATCTLAGGVENDWDTGDSFKITGGYWVHNLISGAKCQVVSNSANTAVCTLTGGDRQTWNTGDTYKIANGYPCRDQIGRGPDNPQWDHNSPGAYTQPLIPAYAWNNRRQSNNDLVPFVVINAGEHHIQENRDYYNQDESFDGTSGVGTGTLAQRPATCTTGVGYWATDQGDWNSENAGADGQLYKCTSTDTWELYYTPYAYPHPLRGESLGLRATPADQAIHLTWQVGASLPATSTWQIAYDGPTGDQPSPISGIINPTRAYTLTGLTNYTWYTVTLNAMSGSTPFLTDTVQVMPTDISVYLPIMLCSYGP